MSVLVVGTSSAELLALLPWGVHLARAQRTACVLVAFEAGAPGSERPEELVLDGECDDSLAEQVCAALRQWEAPPPAPRPGPARPRGGQRGRGAPGRAPRGAPEAGRYSQGLPAPPARWQP